MGGKPKSSERTKGNTRASSSGKAAQFLETQQGTARSLLLGLPDSDAETRSFLKRLSKPDIVTRYKALQELEQVLPNKAGLAENLLMQWPRAYARLSLDSDVLVREACQRCQRVIVNLVGKKLAPHLSSLMTPWLCSQGDPHHQAAAVAIEAFDLLLPNGKQDKAITMYQLTITKILCEYLTNDNPGILVCLREQNEDGVSRMHHHLLLVSMRAISLMIRKNENAQTLLDALKPTFDSKKFWKLAQSDNWQIVESWCEIFRNSCQYSFGLVELYSEQTVKAVLLIMPDPPLGSGKSVWETAFVLTSHLPEWCKYIDIRKVLIGSLCQSLREGGRKSHSVILGFLPKFLDNVPVELRNENLYMSILAALSTCLQHHNCMSIQLQNVAVCYVAILKQGKSLLSQASLHSLIIPLLSAWQQDQPSLLSSCLYVGLVPFFLSDPTLIDSLQKTCLECLGSSSSLLKAFGSELESVEALSMKKEVCLKCMRAVHEEKCLNHLQVLLEIIHSVKDPINFVFYLDYMSMENFFLECQSATLSCPDNSACLQLYSLVAPHSLTTVLRHIEETVPKSRVSPSLLISLFVNFDDAPSLQGAKFFSLFKASLLNTTTENNEESLQLISRVKLFLDAKNETLNVSELCQNKRLRENIILELLHAYQFIIDETVLQALFIDCFKGCFVTDSNSLLLNFLNSILESTLSLQKLLYHLWLIGSEEIARALPVLKEVIIVLSERHLNDVLNHMESCDESLDLSSRLFVWMISYFEISQDRKLTFICKCHAKQLSIDEMLNAVLDEEHLPLFLALLERFKDSNEIYPALASQLISHFNINITRVNFSYWIDSMSPSSFALLSELVQFFPAEMLCCVECRLVSLSEHLQPENELSSPCLSLLSSLMKCKSSQLSSAHCFRALFQNWSQNHRDFLLFDCELTEVDEDIIMLNVMLIKCMTMSLPFWVLESPEDFSDLCLCSAISWLQVCEEKTDCLQAMEFVGAALSLCVSIGNLMKLGKVSASILTEWNDFFQDSVFSSFLRILLTIGNWSIPDVGEDLGRSLVDLSLEVKASQCGAATAVIQDMCCFLASTSIHVQYSIYNILSCIIGDLKISKIDEDAEKMSPPHDIMLSIEAAFDPQTQHPKNCLFYSWLLLLAHVQSCSIELRAQYAAYLQEKDEVSRFLTITWSILESSGYSEWVPNRAPSEKMLASFVYNRALECIPALARTWFNSLDRVTATKVEKMTAKSFSPELLKKEWAHITNREIKNMSVKVRSTSNEVVALYHLMEMDLELSLSLSSHHPLGQTSISTVQKLGVSNAQWRTWVMQLTMFLNYQNGSLLDGLLLLKRNLDNHFEGVDDCMICYSVIHGSTYQLPKLSCKICRKKFHSACLYKWFTTSGNSTCPLCRNIF